MQTPKASKNSSSTQTSQKSSPSVNRTARLLKVAGPDFDSAASPTPSNKMPKNRSPRVIARGSPQTLVTEKKQPTKLPELQSQLALLQDELKRAKEQVSSLETSKRNAEQEAEETKKQLEAMSERLEDSQEQLHDLSSSEDARIQELRKLSQERDRAWQSELEAVQNQHSMDSTALTASRNEVQKLKRYLEENAYAEIQSLRAELSDTRSVVESMKIEINECKASETRALEVTRDVECLRSERLNAIEAYNNLASVLEQSKDQVRSMENLVSKLREELENKTNVLSDSSKDIVPEDQEEDKKLKDEIDSLGIEVGELKSSLEASELRYEEEYIQSTLQIRNAYDQLELLKSESSLKEAQLEEDLQKAKTVIEDLKSQLESKERLVRNNEAHEDVRAALFDKESEFQMINEENKMLKTEIQNREAEKKEELQKAKTVIEDLKSQLESKEILVRNNEALEDVRAALFDKESEFQMINEENKMLKTEIQNREAEKKEANEEALLKMGQVTEEADKSAQKAARASRQLEAAQKENSELEAEMRRLKVQSEQWRKAAEAAAAMLSSAEDNNGKIVSRIVSFDNNTLGGKMGSPLSDDNDDLSKKKNGNVLKKIGELWKKGHK